MNTSNSSKHRIGQLTASQSVKSSEIVEKDLSPPDSPLGSVSLAYNETQHFRFWSLKNQSGCSDLLDLIRIRVNLKTQIHSRSSSASQLAYLPHHLR